MQMQWSGSLGLAINNSGPVGAVWGWCVRFLHISVMEATSQPDRAIELRWTATYRVWVSVFTMSVGTAMAEVCALHCPWCIHRCMQSCVR